MVHEIDTVPSETILNHCQDFQAKSQFMSYAYSITWGNTQFNIQIEIFLRNSSHNDVLYIKNALVEVMQQVYNLDNVYLASNPIYFLGFVGLQISWFTYKTLVVKVVKLEISK